MERYPTGLVLGALVMLLTLGSANAGGGPGCPGYAKTDSGDAVEEVVVTADATVTSQDTSQKGAQGPHADFLPIVKVAPVYPQEAITKGIEGHVLVEFAVTEKGKVRDAVVVEADPPGTFDEAALTAVGKFRYKPKVVDGKPVAVEGVRNRISFEISDD
ncbi:MAG: energy transducer TonB [Gammaproteobacteria bacterium]|nr:energy transducer TonB [Gammaproteobacteria bacterium]